MKKGIIEFLRSKNIEIADVGPYKPDPRDDYPDYTIPLVKKVLEKPLENKGIVICKNGVGISVLANKIRGIRAGLSWNPEHAASSRNDDDTNVLALPANYISQEEAEKTAEKWLNTPFSGAERHKRRLDVVKLFETGK